MEGEDSDFLEQAGNIWLLCGLKDIHEETGPGVIDTIQDCNLQSC